MPTLYLTRGVPASRKTSFAIEWIAESPETRARVNRDDLRSMVAPNNPGILPFEMEQQITDVQQALVKSLLASGKDVIADDTNLRAKTVQGFYKLWPDVQFVDFPVPLVQAITDNESRKLTGGRYVPPSVIEGFFEKFHIDRATGKLPTPPVRPATAEQHWAPYTDSPGLPSAILVDIDGTTAIHNRGPHEYHLLHTDTFEKTIASLAMAWARATGAFVILFSGRDEEHRVATEKWFDDAESDFEWDYFFMRPLGDRRSDDIVKNELFEQYIAGKFNVDFILDDRNRVVQMWRAKGLKVLQVADGNF